jgi:hypothetical protein
MTERKIGLRKRRIKDRAPLFGTGTGGIMISLNPDTSCRAGDHDLKKPPHE